MFPSSWLRQLYLWKMLQSGVVSFIPSSKGGVPGHFSASPASFDASCSLVRCSLTVVRPVSVPIVPGKSTRPWEFPCCAHTGWMLALVCCMLAIFRHAVFGRVSYFHCLSLLLVAGGVSGAGASAMVPGLLTDGCPTAGSLVLVGVNNVSYLIRLVCMS